MTQGGGGVIYRRIEGIRGKMAVPCEPLAIKLPQTNICAPLYFVQMTGWVLKSDMQHALKVCGAEAMLQQ
jgi:hypothetical protein